MTLRTTRIRTLQQVQDHLDGTDKTDIEISQRTAAYDFIRRTLVEFEYHHRLCKPEKGLIKRYIQKVTGLSRAQITRLISQHRKTGHIRDHRGRPPANAFERRYNGHDIALLAEVDEACGQLSGPATKVLLRRMFHVYGDKRFERLANISNGHIYNIRKRRGKRSANR